MLGGFLQQMNDSLKYNRGLKRKKKSFKEIYKEEISKQSLRYDQQDISEIRKRVKERLRRNKIQEAISRTAALLVLVGFVSGVIWALWTIDFTSKKIGKPENNESLFQTEIHKHASGLDLKTDYFPHGSKAAETFLKDNLKHQNSESYYQTGEQFRSALYFYDTLITEVYFFKTGDTIRNFPEILDMNVHRIKLTDTKRKKFIEFGFYDGKIILNSYVEKNLSQQ